MIAKRKRVLGAIAAGGIAFLLAGCSPGTLTATVAGSTDASADHLSVVLHCTTSSAQDNCIGLAQGVVDGQSFRALSGHGGFGDADNIHYEGPLPPFGEYAPYGADCTSAPCSTHADGEINGTALYGGQSASYTLDAYDNYPATSSSDEIDLDINGHSTTFTCTGNCVVIRMTPGHVPNTPS